MSPSKGDASQPPTPEAMLAKYQETAKLGGVGMLRRYEIVVRQMLRDRQSNASIASFFSAQGFKITGQRVGQILKQFGWRDSIIEVPERRQKTPPRHKFEEKLSPPPPAPSAGTHLQAFQEAADQEVLARRARHKLK